VRKHTAIVRKHIAIVRKHIAGTSAILALLIVACGSSSPAGTSSTPSPTCAGQAAAPAHAFVVVQHLDGTSIQRCVGFTGSINGKQLMDLSGVAYQTQTFSFGLGVCSVDNEPAQFTQCFPQGKPYWSLFVEQSGTWTASQTGFDQITLHDKDALGWRYVPAADQTSSPPPLARES
jgi:hypothetical protein